MGKRCCVPGCPSRPGPNVRLHRFPNPAVNGPHSEEQLKAVLEAYYETLAHVPNIRKLKSPMICSLHFRAEDLTARSLRPLPLAVPRLLLDNDGVDVGGPSSHSTPSTVPIVDLAALTSTLDPSQPPASFVVRRKRPVPPLPAARTRTAGRTVASRKRNRSNDSDVEVSPSSCETSTELPGEDP